VKPIVPEEKTTRLNLSEEKLVKQEEKSVKSIPETVKPNVQEEKTPKVSLQETKEPLPKDQNKDLLYQTFPRGSGPEAIKPVTSPAAIPTEEDKKLNRKSVEVSPKNAKPEEKPILFFQNYSPEHQENLLLKIQELEKALSISEENTKKYKNLFITEEKIKEELASELKREKAARISAENQLSELDEKYIHLEESIKIFGG